MGPICLRLSHTSAIGSESNKITRPFRRSLAFYFAGWRVHFEFGSFGMIDALTDVLYAWGCSFTLEDSFSSIFSSFVLIALIRFFSSFVLKL